MREDWNTGFGFDSALRWIELSVTDNSCMDNTHSTRRNSFSKTSLNFRWTMSNLVSSWSSLRASSCFSL
ncbi:hypothetical protein CEXT_159191 [Caerostris extrusa]|uniref:Uncharacterized protein n=1 Tax=Caerostris extrusa TaxID=172846 RepID=A0AAV4SKB9_CAEEX|nr:hypothetical protein CEXT_159191 [Caerostris extrusa]